MCDWSNELTLKFLELYKNEPVVWDPTHSCHKDRKKNNDAWVRLSGKLDCSVTDLKKKKDSIMATFRSHLRKKRASIKSGATDIYKPVWFAFEYMESFLAPVYKCHRTTLNTRDTSFVTDGQSHREEISSVYDEENQSVVTVDRPNTTKKITENTSSAVLGQPNLTPSRPKPTIQRHDSPPELQETGNQIKEAFKMLINVITKRTSDKEDDEYDLFGKMLAKKIRKLPEHEREVFMYEIEGKLC
ncbi:uncharacterized protein LOC112693382 isoform X2 [Sipha flava]|uniref:Uncharacterized protein LOC112693382 isoform X2 n=1 Tax=Sipha flava TaxID=143950 RepID=A0A8B8GPG6_9HEMI|nr:uncharacterized protein LOC112693382 isoform X2 [Sipha flava]